MRTVRILWRGLGTARRWWWSSARPSAGTDLSVRGGGPALPAHLTGRPPTPSERLRPATVPSGPWTGRDPLVAHAWPRRHGVAAVLVWAGLAWRVVRREQADGRRARD